MFIKLIIINLKHIKHIKYINNISITKYGKNNNFKETN
jgi:hypothetical protein